MADTRARDDKWVMDKNGDKIWKAASDMVVKLEKWDKVMVMLNYINEKLS